MAMSNRDRIDRGLQLLLAGLQPFVDSVMSPAAQGRDWVELLESRDNQRRGTNYRYSRDDPRFLLKVITDESRTFRDRLSRGEQSFASELRDVGNRWGHGDPFSSDDTYRALDTMERLLTAVGATAEADGVRKLRRDAQQTAFSVETRRAVQAATGVEGHGLKPWREVIVPHQDVRDGNMRGAEFAADLYYVSIGDGSREYVEPTEFFRRTYLTEGLKDLLTWTTRRIGGDRNASPVVNLQTNFGGGKTHSMLALWHLLSGTELNRYPDEVQKLLGAYDSPVSARRVALVGNHISPGKGSTKPDGTHVRTLWGELAWQLGAVKGGDAEARKAYAIVKDADETRSNPGAALGELIRAYAPCLILIDEWVAYARQLYGRDDLDAGTFDTQFTFAQTLTEAVKAIPGAMLVVSIPASSEKLSQEEIERGATDIEVGGLNGKEALARLQQVIRRVADQWRPATPNESFAIVRQRLFEDPGADAQTDIAAVARVFTDFYAKHRGEFPAGVAEPPYEERITAAYPIHPELFDRLFQDWSTLERFQRTRGVLRLMSAVIHTLWLRDDPAPLIMPGGLPLDEDDVVTEITQYVEDHFKPVIDTDIDGTNPTPAKIDASRSAFGQRKVTRRIARTIFFGSAPTLRAAHKGIEQQHIWLGVAMPGDTVGNFGSALHLLSDQANYLFNDGARYWFDVHMSVNRMAREHADRLKDRPEETWEEILRRLREREARTRGEFTRVQIGPEASDEIADEAAVRLVIMHPRYQHSRGNETSSGMVFADKAMLNRGNAQRMNRNMIVFLAPDSKRYEELDQAVRDYLAWRSIASSEDRIQELDLTAHQAAQARKKFKDSDETVYLRISASYHWLLVPVQPQGLSLTVDEIKTDTAKERLAERASDKLHNADLLRTVHGARLIRMDLDQHLSSVWQQGHIQVGKLWEYYCQYVYLPRLAERSVLDNGIRSVFDELTWDYDGFAVASGYDEATGKYVHLAIPHQDACPQITDFTLLVHPERATAQREAERTALEAARAAAAAERVQVAVGEEEQGSGETPLLVPDQKNPNTPEPAAPGPRNTRFYGSVKLDPERYVRDFTRLCQEVIQHLAAPEGVDLEITVDITARKKDGYPDDKARIVTENARTLKFDPSGFEHD